MDSDAVGAAHACSPRQTGRSSRPRATSTGADGLAEIPVALRDYAVETPDLRRYDALLEAARCSA